MLGIFLSGWSGRMGGAVRELIEENPEQFQLVAGRASRALPGESRVATILPEKLAGSVDAVIDFSLPTAWSDLLQWCVEQRLPLVSGTTGLDESQKKALAEASQHIPILWAPNMSLGVAILTESLKVLGLLRNADFQIEEFHHIRKVDKPSGTALWLQEALEKVVGQTLSPAIAIRGGGIFGVHRVHAMCEEEVLTFEHQALNRKVFARGALVAADWLRSQAPGLYQMADVLGLKA